VDPWWSKNGVASGAFPFERTTKLRQIIAGHAHACVPALWFFLGRLLTHPRPLSTLQMSCPHIRNILYPCGAHVCFGGIFSRLSSFAVLGVLCIPSAASLSLSLSLLFVRGQGDAQELVLSHILHHRLSITLLEQETLKEGTLPERSTLHPVLLKLHEEELKD
jgi:hypothetical protein